MDETPGGAPETPIRIDYDNVDVSDIMAQLRSRIAAAAPAASPSPAGATPGAEAIPLASGEADETSPDDVPPASSEAPPEESPDIPPAEAPDFSMPYPELPAVDGGGGKSRVKRLLLKLMRPFAPLIKLLILPVNEELVQAVRVLDYTNRKVDFLTAKFDHDLRRNDIALNRRMTGLDQAIHRRMVAVDKGVDRRLVALDERIDRRLAALDDTIHGRMTTLNENVDQRMVEFDGRLDRLGSILDVSLENVKLLHNLSHNLVVELTKLKIEHESLRNKARILEKDFETLTRRERSLEERLPR
jgi:hypothetical protein